MAQKKKCQLILRNHFYLSGLKFSDVMIVLVHINYSEDHSEKILPLGILSVGSALKKKGYEVRLININERQIRDGEKIVETSGLVGFP